MESEPFYATLDRPIPPPDASIVTALWLRSLAGVVGGTIVGGIGGAVGSALGGGLIAELARSDGFLFIGFVVSWSGLWIGAICGAAYGLIHVLKFSPSSIFVAYHKANGPHMAWRRRIVQLVFLLATIAALASGGWREYWREFPYGYSHCCEACLRLSLRSYADDHGGAFPAGEATPEASLSLLYPDYDAPADVLRAKSVPLHITKAILDRGERLGPDSCGWHYVEGLRTGDDPHLALFWDKVGLDHWGRRLPEGGHRVFFLNMTQEYIPESQWNSFLEEQRKLLVERDARRKALARN